MPRIKLQPHVVDAVREWYEAHPVFSIKQLAEIEMEGPGARPMKIDYATCDRCGFRIRPADNPRMFDGRVWTQSTLDNVVLIHEYMVSDRGVYCGGTMVFTAHHVLGPVGLKA